MTADELDDRAIDALKEFNVDDAIKILNQFSDCDLSHVQNKSAFLCGQMKCYREKSKQSGGTTPLVKGPDEAKVKVCSH